MATTFGCFASSRSSARKSFGAWTASFGCQPTTANTFGNRSAKATALALLSKSVPMLTSRVMPAAAARSMSCGSSSAKSG